VDIYTLNASVVAGTPNVNLGVLWYQIGGLGGRRINDVIKMHLVKVDLGLCFGKVEKMAANVGELDGLMGQLPFTVLLWFDGSTKSSAKNLVSETYPCETDVGAMCPDVFDEFNELENPRVVTVCVPATPCYEDGVYVVTNLL
jgi:hypothetical protein